MPDDQLPRAPLEPSMMAVSCPGCGTGFTLSETEWGETHEGTFEANLEARFPVCEHCGLQFEIDGIYVQTLKREPPPTGETRLPFNLDLPQLHAQLDQLLDDATVTTSARVVRWLLGHAEAGLMAAREKKDGSHG